MTFQPDGGDVPLLWGQLWTKNQTAPRTKTKTKQAKHGRQPLSQAHKRLAIAALVLLNVSLITMTFANASQQTQVQEAREVQALIAPTPVADSVQIQPVQAPTAVEASVVAEKAEPTPTPTKAVAGVSASRTSYAPLVGNWDALLQQYFGAAWQSAKRVMLCESGGNTRAVGPMDSQGFQPIGLFQIKNFAGRPSTAALMDAATNIAYAAKMSGAGSSWRAWACKP
jgi:hypothetical protein